jgi:hypothetical protein
MAFALLCLLHSASEAGYAVSTVFAGVNIPSAEHMFSALDSYVISAFFTLRRSSASMSSKLGSPAELEPVHNGASSLHPMVHDSVLPVQTKACLHVIHTSTLICFDQWPHKDRTRYTCFALGSDSEALGKKARLRQSCYLNDW